MKGFPVYFCALLIACTACSNDEEQDEVYSVDAERTLVRQLGDGQSALPYQRLPEAIRVRVVDRFLASVPDVAVSFSVVGGGGTMSEEEVMTDETGTARSRWTLGGAGAQVLEVSVFTPAGAHAAGSPMEFTADFPVTDCPEAIDADGNQYPVTIIANRCWTVENLRTSTFQNGDTVPVVTDNTLWSVTEDPATAYFNNNPEINSLYGKLYNWYAVADERNLCPAGWHVATTQEYTQMVEGIGGALEAGGKMKFLGTDFWNLPNTAASNASGFSAVGGSYRHFDGNYFDFGKLGAFWTADEISLGNAWMRYLYYDQGNVVAMGNSKRNGLSVRCVAD